ncbi:hypothetical protein L3Q82_001486 [Scortum barcoo]|uniref:Uncharacterized protein n=1 Tax=Scortum barcoo TaxID=214431 RepID=A0ACB8W785_9TELE|nr:hypothetical protein L3Q82_001486 [Scortum barcoo]
MFSCSRYIQEDSIQVHLKGGEVPIMVLACDIDVLWLDRDTKRKSRVSLSPWLHCQAPPPSQTCYKCSSRKRKTNRSSCVTSTMNEGEDREEGVSPSKTSLCGQHGSQTKAQRVQESSEGPDGQSTQQKQTDLDSIFMPQRTDSAAPSCVSMKSDRSMIHPPDFKGKPPSGSKRRLYSHHIPGLVHRGSYNRVQESSEGPDGQSTQQQQTDLNSIFMLVEEHIASFVKDELKRFQKILSLNPESLKRQDEEVDSEEEEQKRSSREAFLKITLHFLRKIKQEDLADCLQSKLNPEALSSTNELNTFDRKN